MSANDWLGLSDRVCVVTGAASGIGRQTAIELAAAGAKVIGLDRDGTGCARTVEELKRQGREGLALLCDVSDPASVSKAAAEALAAFGRCDVLVNNAGILKPGALETVTLADWNELLRIN